MRHKISMRLAKKRLKPSLFLCGLIFFARASFAFDIYPNFPQKIHHNQAYVIYSHGLIVEGDDPRPTHPEFGIYEFEKIKLALFDNGDFNLIAHHRPANTDIQHYVSVLDNWVKRLIEAGVPPTHITLVGFSRGSHLTAFASGRLSDLNINTVLLAACAKGDIPAESPPRLGGHLLSIYETTDVMGSCSALADKSKALKSFKEIAITSGKKHGAFYQPLEQWIVPLKVWIRKNTETSD